MSFGGSRRGECDHCTATIEYTIGKYALLFWTALHYDFNCCSVVEHVVKCVK